MEIKRAFFDANIFIDIFDKNRKYFESSSQAFIGALKKDIKIYTFCDVVTNIYYVTSKYVSKDKSLDGIDYLKTSVNIIPFSKDELSQTIDLMRFDDDYKDLEGTIQYILAKSVKCDVIVTNDKKFVSKDIELLNSSEFVNKYL